MDGTAEGSEERQIMDLEDGELASSDNEDENPNSDVLEDPDYVIIERPKSAYLVASAPTGPSSAKSSENVVSQLQTPEAYSFSSDTSQFNYSSSSGMPGDKSYSEMYSDLRDSSDKDSTSDSDSDSDVERRNGKRSRMIQPFPFGGNADSHSSPAFGGSAFPTSSFEISVSSHIPNTNFAGACDSFRAEAEKFQKQRKVNPIWSNVIQEEQISNIFDRVQVAEPGLADIEVTRGVETYTFQRPMREPRQRRASDSSDVSSEGLSDNALHYLRDGIINDDEEAEGSSEHSLPKSFTSSSVSKTAASRKATKWKRERQKQKRKLISKLKKMKSMDLAKYFAKQLVEDKDYLLNRAIEILGKDTCIRIFFKTLKIERRGGIMVKNQKRRRTAGGVFLYLIRGNRRIPKSQVDLIFKEERQYFEKVKRKKAVARRARWQAKLEAAKATWDQGKQVDESDGDMTAVPVGQDQGDGTDTTGQLGDDSAQDSSVHDKDQSVDEIGLAEMNCGDSDA